MNKRTKTTLILAGVFAAAAAGAGHYVFGEKESVCDSKNCGIMLIDPLMDTSNITHHTKDKIQLEFPTIRITYHANGVFYRDKSGERFLVRPSDAKWLVANVAEEEFDRVVSKRSAEDLLKNQGVSEDVLAGMQRILAEAPIVVTKVDVTTKLKAASLPSRDIK